MAELFSYFVIPIERMRLSKISLCAKRRRRANFVARKAARLHKKKVN
jgi:hypothetical protein